MRRRCGPRRNLVHAHAGTHGAARQNVAYLERLGALGETPPRMTAGRMILIAAGIVAALAFYALVVYLQGV